MQANGLAIEREASRRLPGLLAELLSEPAAPAAEASSAPSDKHADLLLTDGRGRRWLAEIKTASGPALVLRAAEQLHRHQSGEPEAIPLLVVPYMSPAGTKAAQDAGINWIDLSGNAHIRTDDLYVHVEGHPSQYRSAGRPSSPFAPKSARLARALLIEPGRWWRQKDLVSATGLDDGNVSRIVRRLNEELLLEHRERELRPRDPDLLLDAWAQDYRFDRHDIILGHLSGSGIEVARSLGEQLDSHNVHHAFTGLPAAWTLDRFAQFRLNTVYVEGDPRDAAERIHMRSASRGANVQLVGPNDEGVFTGEHNQDELNCVAPVQIYLDLLHLPERADEAARHLRSHHLQDHAGAR
jgi:Transcriptional regulator, AbiEi antitoxin, Type IV TA system